MKKIYLLVCWGGSLFFNQVLSAQECPQNEYPVGFIKSLFGKGVIIRKNEDKPYVASKALAICSHDMLKTEQQSYATVLFDDDSSEILVYPKSEFRVEQYQMKKQLSRRNGGKDKGKPENASFDRIKGQLKFFFDGSKHNPATTRVKYKTANSVMTIRGTSGVIVSQEGTTTLAMDTGKMTVQNVFNPAEPVLVKRGYWGRIIGTQAPQQPKPITKETYKEIHENFERPEGLEVTPFTGALAKLSEKSAAPMALGIPKAPGQIAAGKNDEDDDKNKDSADADKDSSSGTFLHIGPVISLGLPRLFNGGVEMKLWDWFGFGVYAGGIPDFFDYKIDQVKFNLSYLNIEGRGVLYPFKGSFFIGCGIGYENFKGNVNYNDTDASGNPLTINGSTKMNRMFVSPQFGWLTMYKSGFVLGTELGATIPVAGESDLTLDVDVQTNNPDVIREKERIENAIKDVETFPLPFWHVIKVGFLF